jgi:SIR2-like domain
VIIETTRNRTAYIELVELLGSRSALAFVGAGVTLPLGYPSWPQLIAELANAIRATGREEIQSLGQVVSVEEILTGDFLKWPLTQAQILKENLGEAYFPLMSRLFGPKPNLFKPISDLVNLPFRHFLTSNYDTGLEFHWRPSTKPLSICLDHAAAGLFTTEALRNDCPQHIVHVHGRYDEPRQIILTEEDYGRYERSPILETFWRVLPVVGRFVFFGFSFEDLDLLFGFRRVRMLLQPPTIPHFAIMQLSDPAIESSITLNMGLRYGVKPVFYPKTDAGHGEYYDLLNRLTMDVLGSTQRELVRVPIVETIEMPGDFRRIEATILQQATPLDVQQGVERLRQMTRDNIARRRTGELE